MAEPDAGGQRFRVGDRVRVLDDVASGNPRTPHYLRGRTGTVVAFHGIVVNPLDHRQPYPPLYSIVFAVPGGHGAEDEVLADLHEEWLVEVS
jgi:nitrile hydratase subunit beta